MPACGMRYGIVVTTREPRIFAELAKQAEASGWDAVFSWETPYGLDAWTALAAAAMTTRNIRLGTMLTPVPRWKPWHLAATALSLDHLCEGRVILSVGIGAMHEGWLAYEPELARRERAEILDESLDIMFGLWREGSIDYDGAHFQVSRTEMFAPGPPIATPRITTWCVGMVEAPRSMRRAARCDGLLPNFRGPDGAIRGRPASVTQWAHAAQQITQLRADAGQDGPYDIVGEGSFELDRWDEAREFAHGLGEAGYTWYVDSDWSATGEPNEVERLLARIAQGPPA